MMGKMCVLHKACAILVLVGALNWGLVGAFQINLVNMIFGPVAMLERIIYILVGISALIMLGQKKCCGMGGCSCSDGGCQHCNPKKEGTT
jgi:uncharacterized protein